jgi:hypothetical protein
MAYNDPGIKESNHYILVLWDTTPSEHATRAFFAQIGIGLVIAFFIVIGILMMQSVPGK